MFQILHYGKACAVVVAMEAVPPTIKQTASMPGVCTCIRHHPRTMVEALQLSGQVTSFQVPLEIMGSIVKVCLVVLLGLCRQQWCRWMVEGCCCEVLACRPCMEIVCARTVHVCEKECVFSCGMYHPKAATDQRYIPYSL